MGSEIIERDLGGVGGADVEFYFYRFGGSEAFAIEETLPESHRRSRRIEALSNFVRPFKTDERIGFAARRVEEMDPLSVKAIARLVGDLEPRWVRCVREACRETNDLREIADACELELHAAGAIVSNLVEAGELPPLGYAGA